MRKMWLIIKCEELNDQYECDANRIPYILTEHPNRYGLGWEIWEIMEDNTLKLYKEYDVANEEGMAIYFYSEDADSIKLPTKIYEKMPNMSRDDVTKSQIKNWKELYNLKGSIKTIKQRIYSCGYYEESVEGGDIVIGEYADDCYSYC